MSDLFEYKCPACGGAMEFDSTIQKMKCPYCDTVIDMSELESKDESLSNNQSTGFKQPDNKWSDNETEHMSVFTCQSCGGEIVGDENTAATSCPYCGNAVVMSGKFSGTLKPDYVIPFKLDKKAAKEKYLEHINGKFLLPNTFKDQNHIDEIKGIYVPFWLFDSDVEASANFNAQKIRKWSDSKYDYTETSHYDVFRSGKMSFRNIPVDGSSKMADDLMESIEPFDFNDAVPFQTAYLAGYFADKYDVDEKESEPRANNRISESATDLLQETFEANYTIVGSSDNKTLNINDGRIKYALYPVWMLTTTYKGEKYTFAMNGQTGKFVGNLPVDKGKRNGLFCSVLAGATVIGTALAYFFFS